MKKFLITLIAFILPTGVVMAEPKLKTATFAGGCFWCMEAEFSEIPGVSEVTSGYTGGHTENPTYEQVSSGGTGHLESIEITYDPTKVAYEKLLEIFWDNIDPLDEYGQFCDKGSQYRAGIFVHDDEQKKLAEKTRDEVQKRFSKPIATMIRDAGKFWPAEDYHQQYFIKSQDRYKRY
ncbi:MAG: peptide-methionine (S)-S-oxide reductase MsrA, partial [Candidatus Nitrotoga sp.]